MLGELFMTLRKWKKKFLEISLSSREKSPPCFFDLLYAFLDADSEYLIKSILSFKEMPFIHYYIFF